jgi:hypothetical protein
MNIKNKYCLLSTLNQDQIDKLVELMPKNPFFDFLLGETVIGFTKGGSAGTFNKDTFDEIITYKEMLSLLGEEEELVPHVHQKEIIAWAKGEVIEHYSPYHKDWFTKFFSGWPADILFRVKPKLTPTQLQIAEKERELSSLKYQDAVERGVHIVLGEVDASN